MNKSKRGFTSGNGLRRRAFLRGTAGAAIALPFFHSLARPSRSAAQATKRFIAYCQPLGTFGEEFFPHVPGGSAYVYPTTAECDGGRCRQRTFRTGETFMDTRDWTPSTILAPLEAHRDDLLILENIDNYTGNHKGYAAMLTGDEVDGNEGAIGISVDQVMATSLGRDTKFGSLHFGVRSANAPGSRMSVSWLGDKRGIVPESDPQAMFRRVFSDVRSDPSDMDQALAERRSVLDAAMGQAESLRRRLGREDQQKLEQYLEAFRDVERRIALMPSAACVAPEEPDADTGNERRDLELVPEVTRAQIDLLVMSMVCDLTRVSTFQMAFEATNMAHPFLGVSGRWHDLSHNGGSGDGWQNDMQDYVRVSQFNAEQIGYLIDRMKFHDVFDGTVILWVNPMQNGQIHNSSNLPLMLAGNAGGFFDTGRHVRFEADKHLINDLHVSLLQSMGIERTEFGAPEGNRSALTELHS
ncbi:MAG: DUF1552 domain-containing protein [Myxococcota bacterium]